MQHHVNPEKYLKAVLCNHNFEFVMDNRIIDAAPIQLKHT